MALKVSYNDQIHRVSPPEDYNSLLSTVISKYPNIPSKPLNLYYLESLGNKISVQSDNYKQLLESTSHLKIFIEVDEGSGAEKIQDKGAEQVNPEETIRPLDVQENIEDKENTEQERIQEKEKVSMEEIQALQADLLVSTDDMTFISRVFEKVKERVLQKSHVFGAFLMFSGSVANYQKLELFNKLQISKEDLIKDKNSVILFTGNSSDLHKALESTQEWCSTTKVTLDKEKSAIMEFLPRRARKLELTSTSILDIPVVREFKYKGLLIDQKLMFPKQISCVRQKALAIASKMKGELENCSFEARVEAWKEFIEPLFESLLPIYAVEETSTRRHELEALIRVTFRRMTQLQMYHSNEEVETAIGYKLNERAQKMVEFYKQSWEMKH